MTKRGTVYLVGAGPGDPGLITVRGAELVASADVIVYDGLIGDGLLELPGESAEMIYAGKKRSARGAALSQAEICEILVGRAAAGDSVVRLKGGDPLVFGRAAEELDALLAAGVPFEIVPGVSSLTAVPAYAGIALTRRGVASTVAFTTGHAASGRALDAADFAAFANADTVVLFMAVSSLDSCARRLIDAGRPAETPAAAIYWGTTASQRTLTSTLGEIAAAAKAANLKPPALIIVGDVSATHHRYPWLEARPLAGARVLIGRPARRGDPFAGEIARLGGEPLIAPLTALALSGPATRAAALAALAVPRIDWLLVTSAAAVEHLVSALLEIGRDLRALGDAKIGCVGESTAKALERFGLRADLVPPTRSSSGLAEALLATSGAAPPPRVLVVRAEGGREEAEDALRAAGCDAVAVALYRSVTADPDEPALARALERCRLGEIDVLPFFAPSQVEAFVALAGAEALTAGPLLAAIGKTTAAALARYHAGDVLVASDPSAALFATEIAAAYRSHSRAQKGHS